MNTKQLIAGAAIALVGVAASAQSLETQFGFVSANPPSSLTRQDVQVELVRARQAGELPAINPVTAEVTKAQKFAAPLTRAQVQAELAQAGPNGPTNASNGFGFIDNKQATARTREEVRNEAIAASRAKKPGA